MKPPLPHAKLRASVARRANQRDTGTESLHYDSEPEPNMRLSRAIAVVLILHIVAIGGVLAFSLIKDRAPQPGKGKTTAGKDTKPPAPAAPAASGSTAGSAATAMVAATGLIPSNAAKRPEPTLPTEKPAPIPAVISAAPPPASTAAPMKPTKPMMPKTITYTVRSGDTLARVATEHGITLPALIAANDARVTTKNLTPGQEIQIPLPQPTLKDEAALLIESAPVTAATGSSLPAPTKVSAPAPVPAIPAAIKAPAAAPIPATIAAKPATPPPPAKELTHTKSTAPPPTMAKSTTSPKPAAKSDKVEPRIEKALPVDGAAPLKVTEWTPPPASWEQHTYAVAAGDTPTTISKKFGVTENALLKANGLADGSRLRPGQRLVIPSRKPRH